MSKKLICKITKLLFWSNRSENDPSIELYPEKYCKIVDEVTEPTCLETSILEIWARNGFNSPEAEETISALTSQDILDGINTKNFSEVFLYNKNFHSMLGGIIKNETGHIIGQYI